MHEQSQTVRVPTGGYRNINGLTGIPLHPRFPFEKAVYPDLQTALFAAKQRSMWEGKLNEQMGATQELEAAQMMNPTSTDPRKEKILQLLDEAAQGGFDPQRQEQLRKLGFVPSGRSPGRTQVKDTGGAGSKVANAFLQVALEALGAPAAAYMQAGEAARHPLKDPKADAMAALTMLPVERYAYHGSQAAGRALARHSVIKEFDQRVAHLENLSAYKQKLGTKFDTLVEHHPVHGLRAKPGVDHNEIIKLHRDANQLQEAISAVRDQHVTHFRENQQLLLPILNRRIAREQETMHMGPVRKKVDIVDEKVRDVASWLKNFPLGSGPYPQPGKKYRRMAQFHHER